MCDDFRQQLFSNDCVQCAVSSFTFFSFDRDRVMTSTSMFGSRNKGAHIFTPYVSGAEFRSTAILFRSLASPRHGDPS